MAFPLPSPMLPRPPPSLTESGSSRISPLERRSGERSIYKLHLLVKDESGSATFVVFDREAEKLTKDTDKKLLIENEDKEKYLYNKDGQIIGCKQDEATGEIFSTKRIKKK
uniref:Replication factor A C-terminal domain-containing protein n=1 Tax=Ananas comosus var. bracteatus TaxID=296719 RepID=A0A6V7NS28_ANACO|nr:unnamed protein product [Ananas comosus var. bracteatus]